MPFINRDKLTKKPEVAKLRVLNQIDMQRLNILFSVQSSRFKLFKVLEPWKLNP